jgi:hypothetical protein
MRLPRLDPHAPLLRGPAPALPRFADRAAEAWARLGPRPRALAGLLAAVLLVLALASWARGVQARWGGSPVTVLVASSDLAPGDEPHGLRSARLPPALVPPDALRGPAPSGRLAFALPAGGVLTSRHLDPRGPGAGLPSGLRALPIPVERGWGVEAGGWVDVWVLGAADAPARLIGRSCPVLVVAVDGDRETALVALPADQVGSLTEGLALGRVLLAHAPPPEPPRIASPDQ